jgi:transcription elongation factor Elf1
MNQANELDPAPVHRLVGRIRIYPEVCCEECGEVIHNHFDCPACGLKYSPSDQFCDLYEEPAPVMISCEKCGAKFRLHHGDIWDGVWERADLPNSIVRPPGSGLTTELPTSTDP